MAIKTISAVVCTLNRSATLALCLKAFETQSLARDRFEVIVVDNGSTDDTAAIVQPFCERHPNVRRIYEERPGLAIARNAGIRASKGDVVAFTDDDAEPDREWLERLLKAFQELPDDTGIVGGDVTPIWEADRPEWLGDPLLRPLSAGLKWSVEPRFLRDGEWLVEVNSCYSKAALDRVGLFPENLGRVGDLLLSGEGGLNVVIQRAGYRLFYDPAIQVRHRIPSSRLTRSWFRRRSFWQGVSMNLLHRYVEETARRLGLPEPLRHTRQWEEIRVPISPAAWTDLFDDRSGDNFSDQLNRLEQLGYLLESQSVVVGR